MDKPRILLVDDDDAFVESNKDLLEAFDYEVFSASNGTDGIREANELKPDLIILDVMMTTDTEGFETARRIREIPELSNIPILLVTGVMKAMQIPALPKADRKWLPVDRILEKPIDPALLVKEVEKALKVKSERGNPCTGKN